MSKDQVIWITGASSGIGEALALEFARRGARLILSARREEVLAEVAKAAESAGAAGTFILPLDVTDEASLVAKAQAAHAQWGRIDFLLNNAGVSQRSLCIDTDMATYRHLFEVDVFGQIALTKAVLPIMLAAGSGHIAVTASVAGKIGVRQRTGYCAAKHAMMGFFDALRAEVASSGLKVTTITPGFIRTNIAKNALKGDGSKFGKDDPNITDGMDVNACAAVIMKGLEKGKKEIPVGSGPEMKALLLKRYFPNLLLRMVEKMG